MFIEVPSFQETSPALKNFWLNAWCEPVKISQVKTCIILFLQALTKVLKNFQVSTMKISTCSS